MVRRDPSGKLLAELGSFYGHFRGKIIAHQNLKRLMVANSCLTGKRILILGTGPSSAAISKKLIDQYDHIILLNLALKYVPTLLVFGKTVEHLHSFCSDRNRILEVSPWQKLHLLPRHNCIFFPDYPYSVLRHDLSRSPSVLLCGFKKYRKAFVCDDHNTPRGWHFLYTDTPIDEILIAQEFHGYMHHKKFPPLLPYSVVFSAITFYSAFRPSLVHLLGCDFSDGFSLEPMDDTFRFVCSLLEPYDIPLENMSGTQLRMISGV